MDFIFFRTQKKILLYLDQHFREDVGLAECAKAVGYSSWYICRLFKQCFGESIADYLNHLRMTAAKEELTAGKSVGDVAASVSYSSADGFTRAFKRYYGITPSEYQKGGILRERYVKDYDYRVTYSDWMKGKDSSCLGLWEYNYFDPKTNRYSEMIWTGARWEAPCEVEGNSDPNWYCRNRCFGYGMHPGREVQAVRTFLCPHDGEVEIFFSVGRYDRLNPRHTPCSVQLVHGLQPLQNAVVLTDATPVFCKARCTVKKGDKIHFRLDSLGDARRDGIWLYRQRVSYAHVSE